ncbi:hypothetical protein [Mucilaginibacter sp. FT3.2]|uniref:hypothetical protein n=1 Tax=Mucilaginibacter sp. FT3.2 TaxID=2723090 RepID=UPI00160F18B0|nr:hypothetical protein [Mucilaginibacter sp. FT3.2]MBB6233252.1 hypothetical protein [Mucilaginibacter sp. FT3.2]
MEKLIILRMFFCFPLFGLLLPDAGVLLTKIPGKIPMPHLVIEIGLIFCILLCTAVIGYAKKRNQDIHDKANETSFS